MRFPRAQTTHDRDPFHPDLAVTWREGEAPEIFCGYSWCAGACGLPALVMGKGAQELKAHSSMVAYGRMMQPWRLKWKGTKREVPDEFAADFAQRVWI